MERTLLASARREQRRAGADLQMIGSDPARGATGDRLLRGAAHRRPNVIAYSLTSAAVATIAGAVVSLAANGTARVAVWCAVTGAFSIVSGLAWGSAPVSLCWSELRYWVR
jgi:hypothetical protein